MDGIRQEIVWPICEAVPDGDGMVLLQVPSQAAKLAWHAHSDPEIGAAGRLGAAATYRGRSHVQDEPANILFLDGRMINIKK